jgi:hypothetical protein
MIENKYCVCGEPINVEHNARQTFRTDGLRFFPPSDLIPGLCHFRCPACKVVVEYDRLVELGDLPLRPPAENAEEPVNSLQQLKAEIAAVANTIIECETGGVTVDFAALKRHLLRLSAI